MPIYSTIGSMLDLSIKVMHIGYCWLENLRHSLHTGCALLDFELSMYLMASREPHLWRLMFLNDIDVARESQFAEWRRIVSDIENAIPQSDTITREQRIYDLQDISYSINGSCSSINLGTFFYYEGKPQDILEYVFKFFIRVNSGLLPWYTQAASLPENLELKLAASLETTLEQQTIDEQLATA